MLPSVPVLLTASKQSDCIHLVQNEVTVSDNYAVVGEEHTKNLNTTTNLTA